MRASIAVRSSEGSWAGVRASEPSTAPPLIFPLGASATDAAGGRLRRTLSATTLNAAKGSPCAAAIAAAICDSVSTAAAPVARCNSRLAAGSVQAPTSRSAMLRAHAASHGQRSAGVTMARATSQVPRTSSSTSPPAMPKLITAPAPRASSRSSAAASAGALPPPAIARTPGPAAMRASLASPVTATTGREAAGRVLTCRNAPGARQTVQGCGSGRAPIAGKISRNRDNADRTPAGSRSR